MGSSPSKNTVKPPRLANAIGHPYVEIVNTLTKRKIPVQLLAVKAGEPYDKNHVSHPKFGILIVYDTITDLVKDVIVY